MSIHLVQVVAIPFREWLQAHHLVETAALLTLSKKPGSSGGRGRMISSSTKQMASPSCASYAAALIYKACLRYGVRRHQRVLHLDNGSPMKEATMLATSQRLPMPDSKK